MAGIVTLDQVRAHLRYPPADTADDLHLQIYIDAADEVMRRETGNNVPQLFDESYDGGETSIFLWNTPIISIESIEEGWGFATFELDYVQANSPVVSTQYAYSIESEQDGYITRRSSGNVVVPFVPGTGNIRVVYTAGRNPVPPIIQLAELELIAEWWQGAMQRSAQQTSQYGYAAIDQDMARSGPAAGVVMPTYGVPYRILEMIKPYRAAPIIG